MSVELMLTRAVLEDAFSPVLQRIAGNQDAFARKTNALNITGNVLGGAGAAMIGLAVKSVKVAASYDQQRQAFATLTGSAAQGKAMFDDLARFTVKTPFQLSDWTKASQTLMATGMAAKDVMPALVGLGNSEAAMGRTGESVQRAAYALGEMNQGFLSMRQIRMLTMDGVPAIALLKKELHLTGEELAKIGDKHIAGSVGVQAILKGIADPSNHLSGGMAGQMNTLPGSVTSLKDNWNLFLDQMGEPALRPVTNLVNKSSDLLSNLQQMSPEAQKFITVLAYGSGPALTLAGGVLKGVAAYREYTSILKIAAAAGAIERAGEKAKGPIADAEGAAVQGVAGKYGGLRGMLMKVGSASLGVTEGTYTATTAMTAGSIAVGLYAVAFAGLAFDIGLVVNSFGELDKASRDFEASSAAVAKAKAQGYDLKANAGQAQGYNALPVWKQYGEELVNGIAGFATYGKYQPFDTTDSGTGALTDAASRALAKKHGRPINGVMATMLRDQQAQREAAAEARRQAAREQAQEAAAAAGAAANSYQLDPAIAFKLAQDERRVALLKEMGGHEKELKAARAGEIADLKQAADLLDKQASLATDLKAKYRLMDEAAEDRQKAALLGLEKSDKRDKLDKAVAQIIGGAGLSEDEILKRAGIGRAFFAGMGKGRPAQNPLAAALTQAAKRPLIVQVKIGDRTWLELKKEIVDDALLRQAQIARSSGRNTLFGSTN